MPLGTVTGDIAGPTLDGPTVLVALVGVLDVLVITGDAVTRDVTLVEPDDVVIDELDDPADDGLLLGVDMLELIDEVCGVCVSSSEMPLLPSTEPV